ncbi:ANTAR domain-containing protein [Streptomyces sp. TLI_146]|uniref:ANTAR domain-containing protein n=1 Tax=Streptomyces sp. TLI_146 TaxID=1938858 RepID=UPI000CBA3030|nr:ANTAR domain-containing protein [Streptomyces sp. TLI_146]PKV83587.1 ANTAR domain-containing protein [Streptomyces sp. TLI_146]
MAQPSQSAETDDMGSVDTCAVPTRPIGGLDIGESAPCPPEVVAVVPAVPDVSHGRPAPATDPGLELDQLRRAMESRGTIDLARGVLMAAFAISPETAWSALVMTSQNTNTKLHLVAQQVVDSAGGTALPQPVQKQLSAAIAKLTREGVDRRAGGERP